MNPYDEFAVEQALQVKAANSGSTVTVVRVGKVHDTEALRTALAMGADEAILVEAEDNLDSYMTAKALKGGIEKWKDTTVMGSDPIRNKQMEIQVVSPHMIDPEGKRMYA